MKISAISDNHGYLPRIEPCDLLLIAGDICPARDHSVFAQSQFLAGPFADWLNEIPARRIVGIAGNHDFIFEKSPDLIPKSLRWNYLQDASVEIEGLKIYGTPWQPWFYDWAFNLSEEELAKKWEMIPADTDILVVHGPPYGFGDVNTSGAHCGSPSLRDAIFRIKPKLCVFHEGRGRWSDQGVELANVTVVDVKYRHVYPPMTFDISPPSS